jgi:hypothetical protein
MPFGKGKGKDDGKKKPKRTKHVHDYRFVHSFPVPGKRDHNLYRCTGTGCLDEYFEEGSR